MLAVGSIRKTDKLGRIVLPAEIRKKLVIMPNDKVEFYVEKNKIVIKKCK